MQYQEMAAQDQPIIPFTTKWELKNWYLKVFNFAIWGSDSDELYFEDGLSAPIVQYVTVTSGGKTSSRPVYARPPYYREIASCNFYDNLRHGSIIAYNGISGVSRQGINWITLCCRPMLSFDPTPYFKGNSYLFPLSEGVSRRASVPARMHLKTIDAGSEIKCNTGLVVGRSLVLPSKTQYDQLFDRIIDDVSGSVPDDVMLRRAWLVAYLLQPFELAQLSLDASCKVIKGMRFVDWVKTAPASELSDVNELSEKVQNRIESLFELLYGVDNSDTGVMNKKYLTYMLRFVSRMLMTNQNLNVVNAYFK